MFDLTTSPLRPKYDLAANTCNYLRTNFKLYSKLPTKSSFDITTNERWIDRALPINRPGKNSNQMTTAPTYPSTNSDPSSIAERWIFKLDSDYLLTESDLITHTDYEPGAAFELRLRKRQTCFDIATNELQMDSEQTSTTLRTIFVLTST